MDEALVRCVFEYWVGQSVGTLSDDSHVGLNYHGVKCALMDLFGEEFSTQDIRVALTKIRQKRNPEVENNNNKYRLITIDEFIELRKMLAKGRSSISDVQSLYLVFDPLDRGWVTKVKFLEVRHSNCLFCLLYCLLS